MTRVAMFIIWLVQFLPLSVQSVLGSGLGRIFFRISARRRNIALTNLRLCFPNLPERERLELTKAHFEVFGRSFVERGILWWASESRIRRLVRIDGAEHLQAVNGSPVVLLCPHFVGLDMGWTRLTCDYNMVSVYANQKNFYFNAALLKGRERFGKAELLSRQDGIRPAIRAMQQGKLFYYLPDMDYGERDTIFVPFFGYPTATITGVSRIAKLAGARVIPCVTRMLDGGEGYIVKLYPAWDNFPTEDIEADTRRMNEFIEERALEMMEQYYWVHRRFKTRPTGEGSVYE